MNFTMFSLKKKKFKKLPGKEEAEEKVSWGHKGLEGLSRIIGETGVKHVHIGLGMCMKKT